MVGGADCEEQNFMGCRIMVEGLFYQQIATGIGEGIQLGIYVIMYRVGFSYENLRGRTNFYGLGLGFFVFRVRV